MRSVKIVDSEFGADFELHLTQREVDKLYTLLGHARAAGTSMSDNENVDPECSLPRLVQEFSSTLRLTIAAVDPTLQFSEDIFAAWDVSALSDDPDDEEDAESGGDDSGDGDSGDRWTIPAPARRPLTR